jgi:hypothetical protein
VSSNDVSIEDISACGFAIRGMVAALASFASGDDPGSALAVVADRRREIGEVPDSIDDKLGDL